MSVDIHFAADVSVSETLSVARPLPERNELICDTSSDSSESSVAAAAGRAIAPSIAASSSAAIAAVEIARTLPSQAAVPQARLARSCSATRAQQGRYREGRAGGPPEGGSCERGGACQLASRAPPRAR